MHIKHSCVAKQNIEELEAKYMRSYPHSQSPLPASNMQKGGSGDWERGYVQPFHNMVVGTYEYYRDKLHVDILDISLITGGIGILELKPHRLSAFGSLHEVSAVRQGSVVSDNQRGGLKVTLLLQHPRSFSLYRQALGFTSRQFCGCLFGFCSIIEVHVLGSALLGYGVLTLE